MHTKRGRPGWKTSRRDAFDRRTRKNQAVRQTIGSVSLIHIAAHGDAERGESIFSPNIPPNFAPQEILSFGDVWHLKNSAARETGGI